VIPYCIIKQDSTKACKVVDDWIGHRLAKLNEALNKYERGRNHRAGRIAPENASELETDARAQAENVAEVRKVLESLETDARARLAENASEPQLEVVAEVGSRWKVVHPDGGKLRELAALRSPAGQALPTGMEVRVLERELVNDPNAGTVTRVRVEGGGATGWLTCTLPSGKKVIERLRGCVE
jgi:hypothetical protein